MKKLSLIAALALGGLVACSIMANAQEAKGKGGGKKGGGGGGRMSVEQRLEQMTTELSLTDEQKPKVKAVLEESSKKMQEVFASGNRDQMREKMQPIMDEQDKKLKAILKPEQYEKWQKQQAERRSRFSGGDQKKKEQ